MLTRLQKQTGVKIEQYQPVIPAQELMRRQVSLLFLGYIPCWLVSYGVKVLFAKFTVGL